MSVVSHSDDEYIQRSLLDSCDREEYFNRTNHLSIRRETYKLCREEDEANRCS